MVNAQIIGSLETSCMQPCSFSEWLGLAGFCCLVLVAGYVVVKFFQLCIRELKED